LKLLTHVSLKLGYVSSNLDLFIINLYTAAND